MYYLGTWLDKHINWRKAIFSIIEPRSLDREGLAGTPRGDLPRQTYKLGECETVTVCPDLSPLICTAALLCSSTRKRGFIEMVDSFLSPLLVHWTRHRGLDRQAHQSDRHNRQRHQKSRKSQTKSSEAQRQPALHVTASPGSPGISPTLHRLETTDFLTWSVSDHLALMAGHHHDASQIE